MTSFLLSIFCFFFSSSPRCHPPVVSLTTTPQPVYVQPTIALTYKNIFTSRALKPGPHTFSVWVRSPRPAVGYQLILALAGNISNLSATQTDLPGLRNLTSSVESNQIKLASFIADPAVPFTPSVAKEVARITFTANQPNMLATFSLGAPFSKITSYDKQTLDIVDLLENGSASVTIKQLN